MENIKLSATFDDLNQAEQAAAMMKKRIKNIQSIKLNSKRSKNKVFNNKENIFPDFSVSSGMFGGSNFSYLGSVGPVTPSIAVKNNDVPSEFNGLEYSYKKTKLLSEIDSSSENIASTIILSCGGYDVKSSK